MTTPAEPSARLRLRPIRPEDGEFLFQVYAGTREEELAPLPWSAAEKEAFLRMQFAAQHAQYQTYPDTDYRVIVLSDEPIGRLYLARWPAEIRIVDIALLAPYRNQGIGTHLLEDVLAEGRRASKPVSMHVEKFNPAMRLYERLGFRPVEDQGIYLLMRAEGQGPRAS